MFVGEGEGRSDAPVSRGASGGNLWVEECRQHRPDDRQHGYRQLGPLHDGGQGSGQRPGRAIRLQSQGT